MSNIRDRVWMSHPDDPDSPPVPVHRSTFEGSYSHNGWVEAESPAAKVASEDQTSPKVDEPTASKEGQK